MKRFDFMTTTESGVSVVARKQRHGRRAARRDEEVCRDLISQAFDREREHARVPRWPPEYESVFAHFFRCVCCGRVRGEELRREPRSEVCVYCVAEAGVGN
jgi:hypothetical protein